jgi:hypothetical protein
MGALTSKPYAFSARPWELSDVFGFDPFDSAHTPLRLSLRGAELLRVLPDLRYSQLNEWLSDRSRFGYDSLVANRQSCFSFHFQSVTYFFPVSSLYLQSFLFTRLYATGNELRYADCFSSEQALFTAYSRSRHGRLFCGSDFDLRAPASFLFSAGPTAAQVFVVGVSVRYTHPVLFAHFKRMRMAGYSFFDFGESSSLSTYSSGSSLRSLLDFFRSRSRTSAFFSSALFVTSGRIFRAFQNCFPYSATLVLSESPFAQQLAEYGLCSSHQPVLASKFSTSFTAHKSSAPVFSVPTPHPHESTFNSYSALLSRPVFSNQPVPSANFFYDFSSDLSALGVFALFRDDSFFIKDALLPFARVYRQVYSTYNYNDHFSGFTTLQNSTNILLNLKRNEDYRHNHFCYF